MRWVGVDAAGKCLHGRGDETRACGEWLYPGTELKLGAWDQLEYEQ